MATKRDLDDIDLEIVRLLAGDARRSFRDIADHVGLSPPAVSDRVDRLLEQGIVRRFTVDLDRSKIAPRIPVLIELETSPSSTERLFETVRSIDGVEHVFRTVDGRIVAHAAAPEHDIGTWIRNHLDLSAVRSLSVNLLDAYAWQPEIADTTFSLSCVVCEKPIHSDGISAEFDGEMKTFCCPSCKAAYTSRYESYQSNAD